MSGTRRFDVLGLGVVAVDDLLYVDEYPPPEAKVRVRHRERQSGGLTGTAMVAAARLGARVGYAGMLGDDELSRYVIENLERERIDFSACTRHADARPAHSTVIVDQTHQTRTVLASLDGKVGPDPALPEAVIRGAGVLLVDHHGLEGTLRAVRIARESGVEIVADFERDPGEPFDRIFERVNHLVVSRRFAERLSGQNDPAGAAEALWTADRQAVVVTCGAAGCWAMDRSTGGRSRHRAALAVEVVDTTGCGDVFHGVYAAALAEGKDLDTRIRWASAAAALKAMQRGGQAGIPTRDAIERFLAARS